MIQYEFGIDLDPLFQENRNGDISHSLADITKAKMKLGYEPKVKIKEGIRELLKLSGDKIF
jgi:UDP-N-acetylglucosamine 4-epimerase